MALSALPSELEVLLISVTYGNIDVENCLRNVVALFHHIEREIAWRKANGKDEGFECLKNVKPLVAVGPEKPLTDAMLMADFFRKLVLLNWSSSLVAIDADLGLQTVLTALVVFMRV